MSNNNESLAKQEDADFKRFKEAQERVSLLTVASQNAKVLGIVFLCLIGIYVLFILAPFPSTWKCTIDSIVGCVSRFILVAFVIVQGIDLALTKFKDRNRKQRELLAENERLKKELEDLKSKRT